MTSEPSSSIRIFARAYNALGVDYSDQFEPARANEYYTKAFELREHASEKEKLSIEGDYYMQSHRRAG
jgi:hypothetical protein